MPLCSNRHCQPIGIHTASGLVGRLMTGSGTVGPGRRGRSSASMARHGFHTARARLLRSPLQIGGRRMKREVVNRVSQRVATTLFRTGGHDALTLHQSVCDTAAGVADRLGLAELRAFLAGDVLAPDARILVRQLREVCQFARTADLAGWVFGPVMVAPREERVLAAAVPGAELWADPQRGFFLHGGEQAGTGVRKFEGSEGSPLSELVGPLPVTAQHIGLDELLAPLTAFLNSSTGTVESVRH